MRTYNLLKTTKRRILTTLPCAAAGRLLSSGKLILLSSPGTQVEI